MSETNETAETSEVCETSETIVDSKQQLPKIHLPGDEKFISYKNSLQCYCQKMHYSIPLYKAVRESNGLVGTVTFNSDTLRCTEVSGSAKEADTRAAYDALVRVGYLQGVKFDMSSNKQKRKTSGTENQQPAPKRKATGEAVLSKSRLNELAQKRKLPVPTYSSEPVPGGFISTVVFDGNQFKSLCPCPKRKDAEQNAAQVALNATVGAPLPSAEPQVIDGDNKQPPRKPTLSFKNLLQEYCQKHGALLPSYDTTEVGVKTYQTVVTVKGIDYQGQAIKGKKAAETSAAEAALLSLNLIAGKEPVRPEGC